MKTQKTVKIIGLEIKKQLGIIKAVVLKFQERNRLNVIKGEVGSGKTTLQNGLRLGTQGQKVMTDKNLYNSDIQTEVQLLDGETNIWVGTKVKDGAISHVLYTKDAKNKIQKNPIIDGEKATPATYLAQLQTELTWHLNEFTSQNPTTQKNILLKTYKSELSKVGVIFNKKDPKWSGSILDKIEKAEQDRDYKDMVRKQKGGIKDDLIPQGFDPDKPETIPDEIKVNELEEKIKALEKEITILETKASAGKDQQLESLKNKSVELKNNCVEYNHSLQIQHEKEKQARKEQIEDIEFKNETLINNITICEGALYELTKQGYPGKEVQTFINSLPEPLDPEKVFPDPIPEPNYIKIEDGKVIDRDTSKPYISEIIELIKQYKKVKNSEITEADTTRQTNEIENLKDQISKAEEINYIVKAVDSFHSWREANEKVQALKKEYVKLLSKIETGVEGLKIMPEGENIFMFYNGAYDPAYFNNPKKEMRKLSSYSDTQKPLICLLIQNYLLNKKPKALRYLFIDKIPIDNKTKSLLEKMCYDLDLYIFLNWTGDFKQAELKEGEILVEGGEVFFS